MNAQEIMKSLQAPFHSNDIEWRVGSTNGDKTKGLALAYVTNRAIQNRLDEVFGPFGWRNEFKEWKGTSQLCGISIKFEGEWITKWDGSDDSQTEAVKGGLSDSMKRAAYQWGIGRYLYKLPQQWVAIEPRGKSFAIKQTPSLPDWALPEDERKPSKPEPKPKVVPITKDQVGQIKLMTEQLKSYGMSNQDVKNCLELEIGAFESLMKLDAERAERAIAFMDKWINQNKEDEKQGA